MTKFLTTIKIILIAFALGSVSTTLAFKWSDWNLTQHTKEALSILDISDQILAIKQNIEYASDFSHSQYQGMLASIPHQEIGKMIQQRRQQLTLEKVGIVAGTGILNPSASLGTGPETRIMNQEIQTKIITQEVSKVINEINNYTVSASLTEQELVDLVSKSETLKQLLKGPKGDPGPGTPVSYTLPTSTNQSSMGSIAGFTHLGGNDLNTKTLNVTENATFNTITVGGADVATLTGIQTLTNKTLTAPTLTGNITLPSGIWNSSGNVGIGTTNPGSTLDVKGTLRLSGSTSGFVGFSVPAAAGSTTYTLPSADGTSGQVLSTNGAGVLSWVSKTEGLQQEFKGLSLRTHPDADKAASYVYLDHTDEIVMDTGNRVSDWNDLTAQLNGSTTGAGALDTGSEAASTWYEIYAIRKSSDGTKNLLLHRAKDYFLDQQQTTDDASGGLRGAGGDPVLKIAQTFSTSVTGYVEFIDVKIFRTGSPTGRIWVNLYATSGGVPTGSSTATSDKLDVSLISTSAQVVRFVFRTPVQLTTGTTYALSVEGDWTTSGANFATVRINSAGGYASGSEYQYYSSVWNNSAGQDIWFKVYVTRNDTSVTLPSGYDQKAKVGWVYNNSSSNFRPFIAQGRRVSSTQGGVDLTTISVNIMTLTDASVYLPPVPVLAEVYMQGGANNLGYAGGIPGGYQASSLSTDIRSDANIVGSEVNFIGDVQTEYQGLYLRASASSVTFNVPGYTWDSSGGADLAEEYLVHDESISAGDIVSLTDETLYVERASTTSPYVLGIVSTKPGITLKDWEGATPQNNRAIALTGRVPVKISKENGEVKVGDRLTLSKTLPGYAMKQTQSGQSIGIAMESSQNKDKVLTFVNLSFWTPSMQLNVSQNSNGDIVDTSDQYDLNGFILLNVKAITSISGKWSIDEEGVLVVVKVKADVLETKKGITIEDRTTGEPYCAFVDNGVMKTEAGACDGTVAGESIVPATEPPPVTEPPPAGGSEPEVVQPEPQPDPEPAPEPSPTPSPTPEPLPAPEPTPETPSTP